jgi:hypothetical protein
MLQKISFLIALIFSTIALAQEPQISVFNFQTWKEQQILDAQNQTLRVSARISHLKSGKASTGKESTSIPANSKFKKSDGDSLSAAERDLRRAQESLKASIELNIEDYIMVYLPTLRENPEALQALAQKMSKEELAEIFKLLLSKERAPDARRNSSALAEALTPNTRAQVP